MFGLMLQWLLAVCCCQRSASAASIRSIPHSCAFTFTTVCKMMVWFFGIWWWLLPSVVLGRTRGLSSSIALATWKRIILFAHPQEGTHSLLVVVVVLRLPQFVFIVSHERRKWIANIFYRPNTAAEHTRLIRVKTMLTHTFAHTYGYTHHLWHLETLKQTYAEMCNILGQLYGYFYYKQTFCDATKRHYSPQRIKSDSNFWLEMYSP